MILVKNIKLNRFVTDGKHKPMIFNNWLIASRWLRLNGNPDYLRLVDSNESLTKREIEELNSLGFEC